jgi:ribonuclease R
MSPKSMQKLLYFLKDKKEYKVLSSLLLRDMQKAIYLPQNLGHYGLASKCYTHFTSPIRRYPDLFIHRVISEYASSSERQKERFEEKAPKYAKNSSDRERIAQKAEREAEKMKKAEFMEDKIGEVYEGIISSVTNFGIFVELDNTIEGLIRFENLGDEYFVYDDQNKTLLGENSKVLYKIGNKITIEVLSANKDTREIDFKLRK